MIFAVAVAAVVQASQPTATTTVSPVSDAVRAIRAGRLDQARLMIGKAVAAGAQGYEIERLLADLAFESNKLEEALVRYEQLLATSPGNTILAERAGIAALKLGQVDRARPLVARAIDTPAASWRAWNACGVIADMARDWAAADSAYQRALSLAPDQAEVLNNMGWSHLLRGDWQGALPPLEQAARLTPKLPRIANNLELARAGLAEDLPHRLPGESDESWAIRLNDAGVAAQLRGERARAVAAFTRAIEARHNWYERAANNLQGAGGKE